MPAPYQYLPEVTTHATAQIGFVLPVDMSARNHRIVITPPANPQPSDMFGVVDSQSAAAAPPIGLVINFYAAGQKVNGVLTNKVFTTNGEFHEYSYVNDTIGWIMV